MNFFRLIATALVLLSTACAAGAADEPKANTDEFRAALAASKVMRAGEELVFTRPGVWLISQVGAAGYVGYEQAAIPGRFVIGTQRARLLVWVDDFDQWREAISIPRAEITRVDVTRFIRSRQIIIGTDRQSFTFALQGEGESSIIESALEAAKILAP